MELKELKQMVVEANKELPRRKLVKYSWGECECSGPRERCYCHKTCWGAL